MDYKIGDIFRNDADYSKRADFCNQNRLMIVEIEADENGRRFQIVEIPQPTGKELAEQEIAELKQKLFDTDYQAIKFAEGLLTAEEYAEMKAQRQAWRDRINELERLTSGNSK